MPQEHKIVNGRLVLVGSRSSSDLRPTAQPAGTRPRPPRPGRGSGKPPKPPKPWWQQVLNHAEYEVFGRPFNNPLVRYNPVAQAVRHNWKAQKLLLNHSALGVVGAGDNAVRAGYEYIQRASGRPKGDASAGQFGADLDRNVDRIYRVLGATPPSQMSQSEREFDQNRRSIALNVLLLPVTPQLGAAAAATRLGMFVRGAGAFGLNEAMSTFLDDNRGGNILNSINPKLPGAVDVGKDDRLDSAIRSFAPNAATSVAFGAALGGGIALSARGIDAFRNIRRNIRADRAVAAELRHRARQKDLGLLEEDEAGGLDFTPDAQQPPAPAPAPAQPPDLRTPAQQTLDANAAMEQQLGMRPEAAPATPEPKPIPTSEFQDPTQPGADMGAIYEPGQERPWDYDPSLPESTALGKSVEDLSDSEIQAVLSNPGTPVVDRVNQAIEARAGLESRPGVDASMVMAPTDRLAEDYLPTVMRKLNGREDYELRPLFDPQVNPGLWQRAQALTGVDDVSQLSKIDMLDAISASAADGQTPIVNRLMGGQMMPTGEIAAAPRVFQYKDNVNAAGEQLGNSLEGVERWDPNAENIIQVWRDANGEIGNPGQVYVVNGHNRLAAANRLGIPSMRVEYLDAPTAAEARLQGAISNVSDGKGTVFDAAKLAREYGITDPAQLKAMGKPGASGFWKDGIALGKLPEDVLTAAINGQLGETTRKAVIIGESGVDPETMRSAYRYLVQQGPDSVKEATLREMLAMAGRSPAASSADQPDLLTGTEWGQSFNEGLLAKADLAGTVRQLLSREKKLFGTLGRNEEQIARVGQVDAGAAKGISGEASRALTIFDQLKYETGPVGDLLNEGTQRILAGESADQVAKGIKNRLAAAISEAMGKEVGPVTDVVQEEMFAAAGRASDEPPAPVELTPEQRNAAEAQLLHEAIAGGEVRPPSAPIPDLPAPAQVRLDEIDMDAPITPGSKAAQALADEARLALEHARMDAAMQQVQERAAKDGMGYEHLTFDQKKEMGALGGEADIPGRQALPEAPAATPAIEIPAAAGRKITARTTDSAIRQAAESLASWTRVPGQVAMPIDQAMALVRAKGSRLDPDAVPALDMNAARNEQAMGMNTPTTEAVAVAYRQFYGIPDPAPRAAAPALTPAPVKPRPLRLMQPASQPELLLPQDLRRAAPRYGRNTIAFQSDLDRAAYVLANDAVKPSKAAAKFRQVVQEAGLSLDEVVAHGKRVKAALKQAAKGNPGQIELPAQPFAGAPRPTSTVEIKPPAPSAAVEFPAAAPAKADLPDTRGQGVQYHGTSTPIDQLKTESDVSGLTPESSTLEIIFQAARTKGQNIYGQGFYTTDDLTTASRYRKKGGGQAPVTYEIREKTPSLRFFDLDQQIGQDAIDVNIFGKAEGLGRSEQIYDAMAGALTGHKYQSLGEAFDLIRDYNGTLKSQDVFDAVKEYLASQGYAGYTHQGGWLAGGGERLHQVKIYWNAPQDIELVRVAAPAPSAAIKLTPTQRNEIENFNTTLIREMGINLDGPMTRKQLEVLEKAIRADFASADEGGVETVSNATRRSMIGLADKMRAVIDRMSSQAPRTAPTKADITRTEQRIADIDQQMADIRRKAEQEGC
jgi:hypothetical protein